MSAPTSEISATPVLAPHRVPASRIVRRLRSDPLGLFGLALVLLIILCGAFADFITPYDPFRINVPDRLAAPSAEHILGTDQLGRDLFSRVIKGSQIALLVGILSIMVALTIGLALGLVAGYGPRWLDNILLIYFDTIYAFPIVMLALAIVTLLGPSLGTIVFIVVMFQTPAYARLVRTATLSVKNSEFILAERSLGAGPIRVLARHILPNVVGPMLIIASMDIPSVITLEAGLSFFGLGLPPPAPSWGRLLSEGYTQMREAPWIVVAGGIPLILTTLGFTFLGESLRDLLDPKLRRIV